MIDGAETPAGEFAADDVPAPLLGDLILPDEVVAVPKQPSWQAGMTPREIAFTDSYFQQKFNASAAARAIGLDERAGARLRHSPRVVAAIDQALAENAIGRQTVIEQIAAIASANLQDVATWKDGKVVFRDSADIKPEAHAAITGLKADVESGRIERLQMDGKLQMLALLAKVLGLVGSDPAISINNNNVQVTLSKEDQAVL